MLTDHDEKPRSERTVPDPAERHDPLASLVQTAAAGDRGATRKLLDALAPTVLRVVRGVLGRQHAEVDDVTQVALVGIVRALGAFRGECQVHYFAARIATRTAVEARRRTRRDASRHEELDDTGAGTDSPEWDAVSEKRRQIWQTLLDELPEAQAETMTLRVILDYSLEETAAATQSPVNTVRSRIRLARETLRRRIESDPGLAELLEGAR